MLLNKPLYINVGGKLLDLQVPKVMGIINVTPDSFYSGSRFTTEKDILAAAGKMIGEGADILDVGGYSSRPGAEDISGGEEAKRVLGAIRLISRELPGAIISVDTFRAEIAEKAVTEYGAHMINDISGGEADIEMFSVIKKLNVPYIMMHMIGNPRTMASQAVYDDITADILKWFSGKIYELRSAGVKDIIIDPGFGFSKNITHNFELLRRLGEMRIAGLPVLVGLSRKSMIWKTLEMSPDDALNGTTALNTIALINGADILRVHDVKEAVQTVRLVGKLKSEATD